MRKVWVLVAGVLAVGVLAVPAGAKAKVPTADQLVRRLVNAGFCADKQAVDAKGTTVQCTESKIYVQPNDIKIHAYRTRAAMSKGLDVGIADLCHSMDMIVPGSSRGFHPPFRVGSYWWSHEYRPLESNAIQKIIGGKMQRFTCP